MPRRFIPAKIFGKTRHHPSIGQNAFQGKCERDFFFFSSHAEYENVIQSSLDTIVIRHFYFSIPSLHGSGKKV